MQAENLKKKIGTIFAKHGLQITAQANIRKTDFFDVYFDLEADTYRPYNKPNNTPQYIHRLSNHPPSIIKSIPEGVNKRLSSRSSNEEMFNLAAPMFQEALNKREYEYTLKFNPKEQEKNSKTPKKKQKKCHLVQSKRTLIKRFWELVDGCFPLATLFIF